MMKISIQRWRIRLVSFIVWMLAAASIAFWVLRLTQSNAVSTAPISASDSQQNTNNGAELARLLGMSEARASAAVSAPVVSNNRFKLTGIVADRQQAGAALIAIDNKASRPYLAGAEVENGLIVQSVEPTRVHLGASFHSPPTITLELPIKLFNSSNN